MVSGVWNSIVERESTTGTGVVTGLREKAGETGKEEHIIFDKSTGFVPMGLRILLHVCHPPTISAAKKQE